MSNVFNQSNFESSVIKSALPVLVDFWAPWCGPCRMIAPIVDAVAVKYAGRLTVGKLNTDENPDLSLKYGITSIPNILIFKNGQVADQIIGFQPQPALEKRIDAVIGDR